MSKIDDIPTQPYIFGTLFMVANQIDTMLERELNPHGVTTKQWFMSVVITSLFEQPPTIMEVAKMMGSSHQNIKQVALRLEKKGLLKLAKDPDDARVTRLVMTEYSHKFWGQTDEAGRQFMENLFSGLSGKDMENMRAALNCMLNNIDQMDRK